VFELENSYQGKKGDMSYYIEEVLFRSCFDANDATFKNCMAIASCKTLATIVVNVVATAYEMDGVKMVSLVINRCYYRRKSFWVGYCLYVRIRRIAIRYILSWCRRYCIRW
jgi:hypothetical protein